MKDFLVDLVGSANVLDRPEDLAPYREDMTEIAPVDPAFVAIVTMPEQIVEIVKRCAAERMPITARVAGTNIGGLTIPAPGGLVLDMSRMNRVLDVNVSDMVAVIEPGVTQQNLKDYLIERDIPLTLGYSLAPPYTSILANALLGGLTNRSLKYGDMSDWIAGLEVVLADGSLVKTGAWALSDIPFGLVPFPDVTGLFVAWQGTTGIATRMAFQLWPLHKLNKRLFIMSYGVPGTYDAMRRLCRAEICDDIGGLSWPSGKMLLGVRKPAPAPAPGDPLFFLYVDLTAETNDEMRAKEAILGGVLKDVAKTGAKFDAPLAIEDLVQVNPNLVAFANFPTELTFLTQHPGGGLSWIGTYGPLSRMEDGVETGMAIMARHGFAPLVVSRPMRGGHFVVLRFITTFDKKDPEDVARVRAVNEELLDMTVSKGFIMYKTPAWAWERLRPKMDPGMLTLIARVKKMMDPEGLLNPGKLGL
ncbi:FAD-binding oxidoreductase [bacterium]|nr:FAD-binding oxidoreductase [bacterium]